MGDLLHALHAHQPLPLPRGPYPTAKWPEGCTHLKPAPDPYSVDALTQQYEEVEVTLQDRAKCEVRAEWDDDSGPIVHAVLLNGCWLLPEDVLLPARIDCIVAELYVKHNERRFA